MNVGIIISFGHVCVQLVFDEYCGIWSNKAFFVEASDTRRQESHMDHIEVGNRSHNEVLFVWSAYILCRFQLSYIIGMLFILQSRKLMLGEFCVFHVVYAMP